MTFEVIQGDAYKELEGVKRYHTVDCCFTSPDPPETYDDILNLVSLCDKIHESLKDTASLWIQLGDYHNEYGSMSLMPERFALEMIYGGNDINYINKYLTGTFPKWILRSKLVWHRPSDTPLHDKTRFKRDWEYLFWFTKIPKGYYFNPKINIDTSVFKFAYKEPKLGSFESGFPEGLVDIAILATCPPKGTVLDPFAGTGTTGMSALRHGCHFIGIENNPDIATKLNHRLSNHHASSS